MRMGNFRGRERLQTTMAAKHPVGIDHVTVVPAEQPTAEDDDRTGDDE